MSDPIMALEELENIVKSKEAPFQIFVKMLNGKTITINDVTAQTSIFSIMKGVEAKEGLPANSQRLIFAGKQLEQDKTAGDYNLEKEITLHVVLRLNGGKGEFDAMNYLLEKDLYRGNVVQDIKDTKAASSVLTIWGRKLQDSQAFRDTIESKVWEHIQANTVLNLNEKEQKERWWKNNAVHVYAMIQETTHSGNCGDFALIVQSKLLRSTTNQYVSILTMCGPLPDKDQDENWNNATKAEKRAWLTNDKKAQKAINAKREDDDKIYVHNYDHQLCLTYHTPETNLANIDPDRAMVADGWGGNQVASFSKFLAGYNAYTGPVAKKRLGVMFPNLTLSGCQKAEGKEPFDTALRDVIQAEINANFDHYLEEDFEKDQKEFIKIITHKDARNTWMFPLDPRTEIDYDVYIEDILLKLNKIPYPQEAQILREECLDLDSFELVDYFFEPKAKKSHKKFILENEELKTHLFEFLLEKATVLNLGETRAAGLAKHLPVNIDEDTIINQELLDQLQVK